MADGRLLHVEDRTVPVQIGGREAHLAILRDVTARVAAEGLYRTLVETTPDPLIIHDAGRILYANPAAAVFMGGTSQEECIGKTVFDLLPEESHPILRERLRTIGRCPELTEAEYPLRQPGGELRHIHARSVGVVYRGQRATVTVFHDLTARKLAEAERDRALARHEDLFQSAPVGIARELPDRRLVRVNRRMAEMFGYASPAAMVDEVADLAERLFVEPEDYWRLRRMVEGLGEVQDFECLGRRRDGSTFWAAHSVRAVRSRGDGILGFEAFVRDVTERREAEAAVAEHARRVRVLAGELAMAGERERRAVAGSLHDGPVQLLALATLMLDELARRGRQGREFAPALGLLREASSQIRATLEDLAPPALFADNLAGTLASLGREFASRHGLQVEVSCPELPELSREGVAFLCRTAREFLVNAIKHGRAGRADIQVDLSVGCLRLAVLDNGQGFDPSRLEAEGLWSLGLPGLRSLARDLGGELSVESAPGAGARVALTLPLAPLGAAQALFG